MIIGIIMYLGACGDGIEILQTPKDTYPRV